jgi:spore coat polysaccharide biosynthesis protein SpsF
VDTPEDFRLISLLLSKLYPKNPHFTLEDTLQILQQHPEWAQINANVQQKPV